MEFTLPGQKLGLILRVGLFLLIVFLSMPLFGWIFALSGRLLQSALTVFAAATVANALALRVFERMPLTAIGLHWTIGSQRNLLLGFLGGAGAALLVLLPPLLSGFAELRPAPDQPFEWPNLLFVTVVLLFGAVGEEMLFRGYGFQVLIRGLGAFATILPVSVLFGFAHMDNPNATWLGVLNTIGFAILFGYAFLRSGDLWLPIGLHFGWNLVLPLFGVNLSGFTMGLTGFAMHWKVSDIWSGGNYGPEASVLTSAIMILLLLYLAKAPVYKHEAPLLQPLPEA